MKPIEQLARITSWVGACGLAAAVAGCAPQGASAFRAAAPSPVLAMMLEEQPNVAITSTASTPTTATALVPVPETAEPTAEPTTETVSIGSLPTADIALLDSERSLDLEFPFQLARHTPTALSFHCVAGEEALGCATKPAVAAVAAEEHTNDSNEGGAQ